MVENGCIRLKFVLALLDHIGSRVARLVVYFVNLLLNLSLIQILLVGAAGQQLILDVLVGYLLQPVMVRLHAV